MIFKGGKEILEESLFLKLRSAFLSYTYLCESYTFVFPP